MRPEPNQRIERFRVVHGELASGPGTNWGCFAVNYRNRVCLNVISSGSDSEYGWEHVSVSVSGEQRLPTWDEMAFVKELFWDDEETVLQFHPKRSEYVNYHKYVLHMWRKNGVDHETPPAILVGPKPQVVESVVFVEGGCP